MARHRFAQLQQQLVFVPWQVSGERQCIGGVIGAEDDRLRRIEVADESFLFFQYGQVIRHLEGLAKFPVELVQDAVIQVELQRGKVGDGRAVEQGDGAVYVFFPMLRAAKTQDDGGGDFHAVCFCLVQHFGHGALGRALGDFFQDEVGAGFDAEVEQAELVLAQQGQLFGALPLDIAGCGIAGDARKARECNRQLAQDGEQMIGGQGQRIAIGEKDAVCIRPSGGGMADVGKDGFERALDIVLAAIHAAETALVEAAAQRGLDDEVFAF